MPCHESWKGVMYKGNKGTMKSKENASSKGRASYKETSSHSKGKYLLFSELNFDHSHSSIVLLGTITRFLPCCRALRVKRDHTILSCSWARNLNHRHTISSCCWALSPTIPWCCWPLLHGLKQLSKLQTAREITEAALCRRQKQTSVTLSCKWYSIYLAISSCSSLPRPDVLCVSLLFTILAVLGCLMPATQADKTK